MQGISNNKISQEFGEIFHFLRRAKKFTLSETANNALSQSQLARFERGKSKISTDLFFQILENINVSPQEFENNYFNHRFLEINSSESFYSSLSFLSKSMDELEIYLQEIKLKLKKEPQQLKLRLDKISIEVAIFRLDPAKTIPKADSDFLRKYLKEIEIWENFEIQIMHLTAAIWDSYSLATLTTLMLANETQDEFISPNDEPLIRTLMTIISEFTQRGNLSLAQRYIEYIDDRMTSESFIRERLALNCLKARLAWKHGDKSALEMHEDNLKMYNNCKCFDLAKQVEAEIQEMKGQ